MNLLWLGVGLWSVVHFLTSLAPGLRGSLIGRVGEKVYKGVYALLLIGAIALMVMGWRAATVIDVYVPPSWGPQAAGVLVLIAFVLFGLAPGKTNVKRFIRHPQLTGLVIWAVGHLLANGDNRSLVLFGVLGLWALVEIRVINRREGAWNRPGPIPLKAEIRPVAIGLVLFAVFLFAHPYLFGVTPFTALS